MSNEEKAQELISIFNCENDKDYNEDDYIQMIKVLEEDEIIEPQDQ